MSNITKEDIVKAFSNNERKRSNLIYYYYKDIYFHQGFTAKLIARKISEDLGITITKAMIDLISSRIINKQKAALPSQPVPPPPAVDTFSSQPVIKDNEIEQKEKVQEEKKPKFDYYATEKPKESSFREALKKHYPKDKQ